jgi:hypothetical protein
MLAELSNNEQNNRLSSPACGIVRLQDFFHGLVSSLYITKYTNSDGFSTLWVALMPSPMPPRQLWPHQEAQQTGFTVL